jgi:DNA-binding MarR family transcriptional regulator
MPKISVSDYRALAAFRCEIRKFLAFSEKVARNAGIEPQQHQLLLAVQGLPANARPTIRAVAERLCVQHHTTVALVDKLEARGLIKRERSQGDHREVQLELTKEGSAILRKLSEVHREHLQTAGPPMVRALSAILGEFGAITPPAPSARRRVSVST